VLKSEDNFTVTSAKFICKTRDISQASQDYLQYKSKSKFQYVRSNLQDIPDKAFFFTPFDKFKVQRQIYFRRVQVQTNGQYTKVHSIMTDEIINVEGDSFTIIQIHNNNIKKKRKKKTPKSPNQLI
jgi:hypothetical protein